ncbi:MAG: HD domain-containing protein [Planctomycetes bacterium]|nr:HD domain-containing protein [Planctomycetota bacterium]
MARQFINQFGEGEAVEQIFLASEKQLRTNRAGRLYLQVRLSDRTGSMTAMMWNAGEKVYESFDNGDFVRVGGTTQVYNGALQMIANRIDVADRRFVDESDFVTLSAACVDRMARRLAELLREIQNVALRDLAECFLVDGPFMDRFAQAPAAVKHHHAYRGGLLEHVVGLMEVAAAIAPHYPQIDAGLLRMGVFLHDLGKVDELGFERELHYTDAGQLLGHITLGVEILSRKIEETERLSGDPFPTDLGLRLKHMILSHHGEYEFGSPKLPMTLESLVLHQLDTLDAKLHSFTQIVRDDVNSDSRWTTYQAALGRKLYKTSNSALESPVIDTA